MCVCVCGFETLRLSETMSLNALETEIIKKCEARISKEDWLKFIKANDIIELYKSRMYLQHTFAKNEYERIWMPFHYDFCGILYGECLKEDWYRT